MARRSRFVPALLLAASLTVLGGAEALAGGGTVSLGPVGGVRLPEPVGTAVDAATADRCETLDPSSCLLPFPSDHLTVADPSTATGRRLALDVLSMPRNTAQKPIDPTEWNRNDGFSPGQLAVTLVPGLDAARTGVPPITDIARSLGKDSPVVVLDATTGERWPVWAELDANATTEAARALLIRPAGNYLEGHRYVIALRAMRRSDGTVIPPSATFKAYRDRQPFDFDQLEARRPAMERIFHDLQRAGVGRGDLFLAWDFTVASERNLSERMLHLRDDAFAQLGAGVPTYAVKEVVDSPDDPNIARTITGTFEVPRYVHLPVTGGRFVYGADGLPTRQPTPQTADFVCTVPKRALAAPVTPALYGHGLLGDAEEVGSGPQDAMAQEHGFLNCATDWLGMATEDVPSVASILVDVSNFPTLPDRAQQGMLDFLFLGRLLKHPQGFVQDPAFRTPAGTPFFDNRTLVYYGNSQGGIMGGALTAVAQDFTRAVLGVPGMNYSTLLRRSVDFDQYAIALEAAYQDELERSVVFSLLQTLWDRGEANGYAHHMTDDPLRGTPKHQVLLHVAFGDHQVANVTAEVEARTIGAAVHRPAPARHTDRSPFWGLRSIDYRKPPRSALIEWDSGTPAPPITNTPPREGDDPHSHPRKDPAARRQMAAFLRGALINVCGTGPCVITP